MQTGAITGYIDIAQVALYVFWLFFAGLVFYLRREDKREGYPLVTDRPGHVLEGFPLVPPPKTFMLPEGGVQTAPETDPKPEPEIRAVSGHFPGAPIEPVGNPMLSGAGPAAYAMRKDTPDLVQETGEYRIVPMRVATDHLVNTEGPNPIGMDVFGADGQVAGTVADLWVDRAETTVRYIEVTVPAGFTVLLPMPLAKVDRYGQVTAVSVLAAQFADAPRVANPDAVTLLEEDRISAYFGSGQLYAMPYRMEPVL